MRSRYAVKGQHYFNNIKLFIFQASMVKTQIFRSFDHRLVGFSFTASKLGPQSSDKLSCPSRSLPCKSAGFQMRAAASDFLFGLELRLLQLLFNFNIFSVVYGPTNT